MSMKSRLRWICSRALSKCAPADTRTGPKLYAANGANRITMRSLRTACVAPGHVDGHVTPPPNGTPIAMPAAQRSFA
jgi:hypothetical protein